MMTGFLQLFQNWKPGPKAGNKELSKSHYREPAQRGKKRHHSPPVQPLSTRPFSGLRLVWGDAKTGRRNPDILGSVYLCTRGVPWPKLSEGFKKNTILILFNPKAWMWVEERETGISFLLVPGIRLNWSALCLSEEEKRQLETDGRVDSEVKATYVFPLLCKARRLSFLWVKWRRRKQPGLLWLRHNPRGPTLARVLKGCNGIRGSRSRRGRRRGQREQSCPRLLPAPPWRRSKRKWNKFWVYMSPAFWGHRWTVFCRGESEHGFTQNALLHVWTPSLSVSEVYPHFCHCWAVSQERGYSCLLFTHFSWLPATKIACSDPLIDHKGWCMWPTARGEAMVSCLRQVRKDIVASASAALSLPLKSLV